MGEKPVTPKELRELMKGVTLSDAVLAGRGKGMYSPSEIRAALEATWNDFAWMDHTKWLQGKFTDRVLHYLGAPQPDEEEDDA